VDLAWRRGGRVVPGWLWTAVLCGLLYAALGQSWLWLVYRQSGFLAGIDVEAADRPIRSAVIAIWALGALVTAWEPDPRSAYQAALSSGLALLLGILLHVLLRNVLWSDLEDGCWVHSGGDFTDLVCYDRIPRARENWFTFVWGFLTPVVTWGAAFALVLGLAVRGFRVAGRRVRTHVGA
jgi:hypothetical protein